MFFLDRDKSGTSGLDQVLHGSGGGIYLEVVPSVTTFQLAGRLLRTGQRFVVRPGERIAADGTVLAVQSAVDRSMMTGESVPVDAPKETP